MLLKSHPDEETVELLIETANSLEKVYNFKRVLSMPLNPRSDDLKVNFGGIKPLFKDYIGASVLFWLDPPESLSWVVSKFSVELSYISAVDWELEEEWQKAKYGIHVLTGSAFFAYMNKSLGETRRGKGEWTIDCGRDLMALFETYDKAARDLGCRPVFLTKPA